MERVYVGNLPPDIRIKDIDDFFRPFGKLVAIDVNNRSNPAFAFVQFDSPRNALSAARNRHGYDYEGYTLQVKLVENNNVGSFEVRNQRRQITPPPPPPLFNNDFNNQMGGGGFGNNNFGRNIGGNSNFGVNSNFGSNNFGNDNFNNLPSSSSFQRNLPPQNMIQYPTANARSIMPAQNNMIEYPSNNNNWESGRGGNSNRGNSNRGDGIGFSNRGVGGNMGNDFNNMGGGGDYSYNPNNNCYADNNFEDRFTQGLSGSGRKWFNRYIRKGFAPKIAREKAIEHRTLPYLRKGDPNQTLNNTVASLPLPALENFGTKIMSLFSGNNAGNGRNFGGNANQMMSNFNNWGNNMQGRGFSNDFNMAGTSFSNFRSGNRNNEIRSVVPKRAGAAMNRNGRPNAGKGPESGILDKMLAEIPTLRQQNQIASKQFNKSMEFLKKLEDKESKVGLNRQDVADKRYNKQFIREYRLWKNKQGILPLSGVASETLNKNDAKKNTKKPENIAKGGVATKKQEPISTGNKTPKQLHQLYQTNKRKLLEELKRRTNPDGPQRRLSTSGKKRLALLKENVGIKDEQEARTLAKLPKEKLDILFTLSAEFKQKTGKSINDKNYVEEKKEGVSNTRKVKATYRSAVKYLKKFEEHDLDTLTGREKALLRICLRRKQRIDEEQGLPLEITRFDYLLTEAEDVNETKEDSKTVKDNSTNEEETIENEENADVTTATENQDENNEDTTVDLTNEQEEQVKNEGEKDEEQNDQENEEITEQQNDKEENAVDNEEE